MHSLLNQLMDFDQTFIDTLLEKGKTSLDFDDLDLIFKVTAVLLKSQKEGFPMLYFDQWMDSDKTCTDTLLERWEELIGCW